MKDKGNHNSQFSILNSQLENFPVENSPSKLNINQWAEEDRPARGNLGDWGLKALSNAELLLLFLLGQVPRKRVPWI